MLLYRAALAEVEAPPSTPQEQLGNLSYSAQYDRLFEQRSELDTKKVGIRMVIWSGQLFSLQHSRACTHTSAFRGTLMFTTGTLASSKS